ncbi:MAG: GGDEF domain-containing protein [Alteromonadaceae bacterium]|nr:GGDEF domain-containing protein [Alteromonadaceae bacterium]
MQTLNLLEHHFTENHFIHKNAFSVFNTHNDDSFIPGLVLLERLQTTLDVEKLLIIFAKEAEKLVDFSGLYFKSQNFSACIKGSRTAKVERTFELKIDNEFIGVLTYSVKKPISISKYKILNQLHQHLLYPLRNALNYQLATKLAMQDALTGLGNRRYFDKQLTRAIHQANRHQTQVGLILGDLNKFKAVNDNHGHQVGDLVLQHVAKAMLASVRDCDSVFRFGGDEFAIIVENASDNSLKIIENRVNIAINNDALLAKYQLTCSLGCTFMNRADNEKSIFERADQALYRQKMNIKRNINYT